VGTHDLIGGLLYLKGLASLAFLGCAGLIEQILKRIRPTFALEGLYLFAWNPLVLLMAIGDGHNDMLMMFIVLLSFWMLLRGSWALALGALTLSAWVKWISLIFLPLQLLCAAHQPANEHVSRVPSSRAGLWPVLVQGGLAALLVTVLVLVPFGPLDWVVGLGMRLLWPANWHPGAAGLLAWVLVLGLLGFTLIYVILILRLERRLRSASWPGSAEQALDAAFLVSLLAFLLGAARSQSWHLIWPATLAGLSKRRWAWPAVVGLSAVMLVSQMWIEWGAPGLKLVP
jgi:hypothetical protein